MKKLALLSFAAAALAAPALAAEPVRFERNGIAYLATITQIGDAQFVEGREVKSGNAFTLKVARGHVTGEYNGMPVAYRLPAAAAPVQTASR